MTSDEVYEVYEVSETAGGLRHGDPGLNPAVRLRVAEPDTAVAAGARTAPPTPATGPVWPSTLFSRFTSAVAARISPIRPARLPSTSARTQAPPHGRFAAEPLRDTRSAP